MSTIYTDNLNGNGEILKQRVEKLSSVQDILSCRDELLLQQSVLTDRVQAYSEALAKNNRGDIIAWGGTVVETSKGVIDAKEKMAKIEQWRSQNITRETLFMIVRNIADMLYQEFAVDDASYERVASVVESIESGVLGVSTTEVSEKDLFAEMVSTVPLIEEVNDDEIS